MIKIVIVHLPFSFDRCVTRGGRGEVSPARIQNLNKSALILGKNALTRFIYGFNFSFKMLLQAHLGKKSLKYFSAGPFFRMFQIKCLSKCSYFQKPPLPWKIPGYAPVLYIPNRLIEKAIVVNCTVRRSIYTNNIEDGIVL